MRIFGLFLVFCISTNIAYAESLLGGSGMVTYPTEKEIKDKTVVEKYYFALDKSSNVTLHFITHVDRYVSIKLMESESENPVSALCGRISVDDNPVSRSVNLKAGKYTFIVYKERSSRTVHNTGAYKFEFTRENIVAEKDSSRKEKHEKVAVQNERVENTVPFENAANEDSNLAKDIGRVVTTVSGLQSILTGKNAFFWGLTLVAFIVTLLL